MVYIKSKPKPASQFQLRELMKYLLEDYECDVMKTFVIEQGQRFNLIEYCLRDYRKGKKIAIQSLELIIKYGHNLDLNKRMFKQEYVFHVWDRNNSLYQWLFI